MRISRSVPPRSRSICALPQRDAALLRGHEAVFHRVGDAHADGQADDARRAFERVGGAHARFELVGGGGVALERQQTRRSAPASGFPLPSGTGRASRTRLRSRRSCQAPLQRVEQQLVVEHADRVSVPRQQRLRIRRGRPWRRSPALPSIPADESGECRALRRPGTRREPVRGGSPAGAGAPCRRAFAIGSGRRFQPEHAAERHTDQQLAAHVRQAQHDAARPVRQRVNRAEVRDFRHARRRQREPLRRRCGR